MSMTYERVVSAALAETQSKFELAEALALEIPPAQRGPVADGERSVESYLEEAREAIVAAGGEQRAVRTLDEYRRTALWVSRSTARNFQWVPGTSFGAHSEARKAGLTYDDFAANSKGAEQVSRDFTNQRRARAATRNLPPEQKADLADNLIDELPPEQQAQIVSKWLTDPDVADEVMQAPEARSHTLSAIERHDRKTWKRPEFMGPEPSSEPDPFRLLYDFRRLHRTVEEIARQVSQRGTIVSAEERDLLLEEVDWLASALSMIRDGIQGGDLDTAISRILAEGGVA